MPGSFSLLEYSCIYSGNLVFPFGLLCLCQLSTGATHLFHLHTPAIFVSPRRSNFLMKYKIEPAFTMSIGIAFQIQNAFCTKIVCPRSTIHSLSVHLYFKKSAGVTRWVGQQCWRTWGPLLV